MRKLLPFLACLMLVLTIGASIGHATEIVGCVELSGAEASAHVNGDGDEVPADADRSVSHHHASCHGHHIGASIATIVVGHPLDRGSRLTLGSDTIVAATEPDLAQRPPKA